MFLGTEEAVPRRDDNGASSERGGLIRHLRGFSRVAAGISSYDGDLSLPLGLALCADPFPMPWPCLHEPLKHFSLLWTSASSGSCRLSTSGLMLSSPRVLPAKPPLVGWTWILAQEKAISIRETWCRAAGTLQLESGLPDFLKLRDGRAAAQGHCYIFHTT